MSRLSLAALAVLPVLSAGCWECGPFADCPVIPEDPGELRLADGIYDLALDAVVEDTCELVEVDEARVVSARYRSQGRRFLLDVEGMELRGEQVEGWLEGEGRLRVERAVAFEEEDEGIDGEAPPPCAVPEEDEDEPIEEEEDRERYGSTIAVEMQVLGADAAAGTLSVHLDERDFGERCRITWDARLTLSP